MLNLLSPTPPPGAKNLHKKPGPSAYVPVLELWSKGKWLHLHVTGRSDMLKKNAFVQVLATAYLHEHQPATGSIQI